MGIEYAQKKTPMTLGGESAPLQSVAAPTAAPMLQGGLQPLGGGMSAGTGAPMQAKKLTAEEKKQEKANRGILNADVKFMDEYRASKAFAQDRDSFFGSSNWRKYNSLLKKKEKWGKSHDADGNSISLWSRMKSSLINSKPRGIMGSQKYKSGGGKFGGFVRAITDQSANRGDKDYTDTLQLPQMQVYHDYPFY